MHQWADATTSAGGAVNVQVCARCGQTKTTTAVVEEPSVPGGSALAFARDNVGKLRPPARIGSPQHDDRLVGRWSSLDHTSPGTELHLDLGADGRLQVWSVNSVGLRQPEAEVGTWETTTSVLRVAHSDVAASERRYAIDGDHLMFPHEENWPRLWSRQ